jgi:hypothetical protein
MRAIFKKNIYENGQGNMIKSQIQGSALEESNLDKDYLEKLK